MNIGALLNPQSIAIVGATERISPAQVIQVSLARIGYSGRLMPVNPKYTEILGVTCFPSIADLPYPPDIAAICLGANRCLPAVQELADRGAKAALIYDGGFGETPEGRRIQAQIETVCRDSGMMLIGPNCMGILSPWSRSTTYISEVREPEGLRGNVGFISQSGAICVSLVADVRRFGISHLISSGNEAVVDTADFIEALVDDDRTEIIACFTEAVHAPDRYVAALDKAANAGKPVIVLKAGRSERTRKAIATHTGGLAGEARVFSEILKRHRAIEVGDFGELVELLAAFQSKRRPQGRRIAMVAGSGGQSELALDAAMTHGIRLPPLSPATRSKIEDKIGPITGDGNPADVWGKGQWIENIGHAAITLAGSGEVDAIAVSFDFHETNPMGEIDRYAGYAQKLIDVSRAIDVPIFHLSIRQGLLHNGLIRVLRENGIAAVCGFKEGFKAISALAGNGSIPVRKARHTGPLVSGNGLLDEVKTKAALREWGVPVVDEGLATTLDQGIEIAARLGYPVVLKAVSSQIAHKSDLGLVIIDIKDEQQFSGAWQAIHHRIETAAPEAVLDGCVVQKMIPNGIEVFAGVSRDPEFGLVLAFGIGGVLIDLFQDFALRPLPLAAGDAETMVHELRASAVFEGFRGAKTADIPALVSCLEAISDFASAHQDLLMEIDLNPIKVFASGEGCLALDGLMVFRGEIQQ